MYNPTKFFTIPLKMETELGKEISQLDFKKQNHHLNWLKNI